MGCLDAGRKVDAATALAASFNVMFVIERCDALHGASFYGAEQGKITRPGCEVQAWPVLARRTLATKFSFDSCRYSSHKFTREGSCENSLSCVKGTET